MGAVRNLPLTDKVLAVEAEPAQALKLERVPVSVKMGFDNRPLRTSSIGSEDVPIFPVPGKTDSKPGKTKR